VTVPASRWLAQAHGRRWTGLGDVLAIPGSRRGRAQPAAGASSRRPCGPSAAHATWRRRPKLRFTANVARQRLNSLTPLEAQVSDEDAHHCRKPRAGWPRPRLPPSVRQGAQRLQGFACAPRRVCPCGGGGVDRGEDSRGGGVYRHGRCVSAAQGHERWRLGQVVGRFSWLPLLCSVVPPIARGCTRRCSNSALHA